MELRQLRYLLAIAQAGSFSRAAADLYMTQPPLSAAIAQLETDMESRLFTRTSRGVTLTETGREVERFAENVLVLEHELRRRVTALEEGRAGTLDIGCTPAVAGSLLPQILRNLRTDSPSLELNYEQAAPLAVVDAVMAGRMDVGLVASASAEDLRTIYHPRLEVELLTTAEMLIALPPTENDLPDPVHLSEVAHYEFAVPVRTMRHGLRVSLLAAFHAAEVDPPSIRDVPSIQEALPLVSAGLAVVLLPEGFRSLVNPERMVFRRLADGPPPMDVSLLFSTERAPQPLIQRFRRAARAACDTPESER